MRDPRRTFSKEEKLVAAWEQDWKTPEGKTIEFDDLLNTDKIQGGHDIITSRWWFYHSR